VGLACMRAGMRYLGVEIERGHYERARWRLCRAADNGPENPLDADPV